MRERDKYKQLLVNQKKVMTDSQEVLESQRRIIDKTSTLVKGGAAQGVMRNPTQPLPQSQTQQPMNMTQQSKLKTNNINTQSMSSTQMLNNKSSRPGTNLASQRKQQLI